MEKEFQSILLEDFPIEWPGHSVQRVALNQHMPRVEKFSEHQHDVDQALLYLRGEGSQHLGDRAIPVGRGSLVFIPSEMPHRFEKSGHRRPVCLVIDFKTENATGWRNESRMTPVALTEIESLLVGLNEEESKREKNSIRIASLILQLFAAVESAATEELPPASGPITAKVQRFIQQSELGSITPGTIAASLERSLDHLNRQLRSECGMTLGELLSRTRFDRCCQLLRTSDLSVGEIAAAVGIDDQNYFSRWFRNRSGQTPTGWRSAMKEITARRK